MSFIFIFWGGTLLVITVFLWAVLSVAVTFLPEFILRLFLGLSFGISFSLSIRLYFVLSIICTRLSGVLWFFFPIKLQVSLHFD